MQEKTDVTKTTQPMPEKKDTTIETKNQPSKPTPPTLEDVGDPDEVAVIETDMGTIVMEFFPDDAPLHVANFKKLARASFYDGVGFHRVLPEFVIQGGDPNTLNDNPHDDGMGGPGYGIKAEFNDRKHDKGILSMARSQDINSGGSQFFICLSRERTAQLDNKYTIFGQVFKGLDIVEKIGAIRRNPAERLDRKLPMVRMKTVKIVKRSEIK